MSTRKALAISAVLFLAVLMYTIVAWIILPDIIPIHWNWRGEVDGYGSKTFALSLMPGVILLNLVLMVWLPGVSPQRFTIESFRPVFNYIMVLVAGLMGYVQLMIIQGAMHPHLDIGRWLCTGICLFLAASGNMLGKVRRNYWMGVRTPWTLSSDRIWNQTHRFAAVLFVVCGLVGGFACLVGVPVYIAMFALAPAVVAPIVYSYQLFREERP